MGLSKWYLCGGDGFPPNEERAYHYAERAAKLGFLKRNSLWVLISLD